MTTATASAAPAAVGPHEPPSTPGPTAISVAAPVSIRPSLLVVLVADVTFLGAWASWAAVDDAAVRRLLIALWLCVPFAVALATRPVARSLVRGSLRRRRRLTMPVVVGVALATALCALAVTVQDGLGGASDGAAREHLGPVDELVVASSADERTAAQNALVAAMADDDAAGRATPLGSIIDGQLALTTLGVLAQSPLRAGAVGATAIEIDVPTVQRFGQDGDAGDAAGFAGRQPLLAGHVLLGRDLADDLRATIGNDISLSIGGVPTVLRVDGVLPRRGVAALSTDGSVRPRVAFVAPGLLTTAAPSDSPAAYLLAISNAGSSVAGARLSGLVTTRLEQLFEPDADVRDPAVDSAESTTPTHGLKGVSVVPVKRILEQHVERTVAPLQRLFASLSAVAVGVSTLFLALAMAQFVHRRRRDVAALRLVGVGRFDVSASIGLEGWIVALCGAGVGSVAGFLLSFVLRGAADASSTSGITLRVEPSAVRALSGGAIGLSIAVVALVVPATAVANRPLLRQLTGAPTQPRVTSRWWLIAALVAFVIGVTAVIRGLHDDAAGPAFAGAALAATAVTCWSGRQWSHVSGRITTTVSAGLLIAVVTSRWTRPALLQLGGTVGFVVQTFVALGAATVLSAAVGRPSGALAVAAWSRITRRFGPDEPTVVTERLERSATRRSPLPTLLHSAGVASAVFLLTASWTLSTSLDHRVSGDVAAARGDWDVTVHSDDGDPAPFERIAAFPDVAAIARFSSRTVAIGASGDDPASAAVLIGFDDTYGRDHPARLAGRRAGTTDDRAVYDAVLADPSLAIVDPAVVAQSAGSQRVAPGDRLFVRDPSSGRSITLTVAGTLRSSVGLGPVLISRAALDAIGPGAAPVDRGVVRLRTGPAGAWVASHSAELAGTVRTFAAAAQAEQAATRQLLALLRGFAALGTGLSVAASSAAAAQEVRRRGRELATLRAVGLKRSGLRDAVLRPLLRLVVDATVVGLVLGVLGASELLWAGVLGAAPTRVPWAIVVGLGVVSVVAAGFVGWRPAERSTRVSAASATV